MCTWVLLSAADCECTKKTQVPFSCDMSLVGTRGGLQRRQSKPDLNTVLRPSPTDVSRCHEGACLCPAHVECQAKVVMIVGHCAASSHLHNVVWF